MVKTVIAAAAALTIGMAAQGFAEGNGPLTREDSPIRFRPASTTRPNRSRRRSATIGSFSSSRSSLPIDPPSRSSAGHRVFRRASGRTAD